MEPKDTSTQEENPEMIAIISKVEKMISELKTEHNIKSAVFVFTKEDNTEPTVWWNSHFYEAGKLMAMAVSKFKEKIFQELDC